MASKHSQPLLQETSESEAENDGEEGIIGGDDLITDNLEKELIRSGQSPPHDKYNFNYIIFYLMGMTTLLPWNFFITAEDVSLDYHSCFFTIVRRSKYFLCLTNTQKLFSVSHYMMINLTKLFIVSDNFSSIYLVWHRCKISFLKLTFHSLLSIISF